ncbi:AfsR/SARP family transcriptional regulator [Phytohabitans sp. ZYX-F-186]|uniref:AfsR/SARP family transcriptional regulator n=1 Tax=Phytohabitans maris TaxID=3071409 RepID=A0ABU0ZSK8_9ACTN|nr:AfsR/SARP family transcriptional regulator [Phytohabitans sp. ZYX-F-186]MDQ7909756.1 AfsR/SARP family transcriptional regulator [Phytohabitans sp. ZYX-F-186]
MEFRLLGPVEARLRGRRLDVGHSRRQCVLVALLVDANSLISVDQLIDRVWGERAPARARETLYGYLSRLRRALADAGDDVGLGRRAGGYLLAVDPQAVDLHNFRALLNRARTAGGDDRVASAALTQALALWRGEAFAGLDTTWIDAARDSVEAERYSAELDLADLRLRGGRDAEVLAALAGRAETHPLDERLAQQLMLAWHRTGRQADALVYYERLRRRLADGLGADPGPELQELHQRILVGDPSPAPARPASAPVPGPSPVPRQLPIPAREFTGRAAELAELDRTGDGAPTVTAIAGMPGVGKTALAIHSAHRLAARYPHGQLYMDLHGATAGLTPLEPLPVLGWFLRALGTDPAAVPTTLAEAAAAFRSRTAGSRLLIVLDNAADAAQVAPLLPAGPECRVLVTGRRPLSALDGAAHMHLSTLPAAEAIELLARLAGRDRVAAEPKAAAELIRWCGSLPLALRIAGARLAARPGWTVAALTERLADARRRLDELQLAEASVQTSFDVSYQQLVASGDEMDTWAAMAFRLLGVPDGPDVAVPVAAELLGRAEHVTERVLERLVDAQLLETPTPGRYRMHDLLRQYARDLAERERGAPAVAAALAHALGWYTATAWRTLDLERANLIAAVRQAAGSPGVPDENPSARLACDRAAAASGLSGR